MAVLLKGEKTILTDVVSDDAEDICMLRNNEAINKYLSSSQSISVEQQRLWIIQNQEKNDGFYGKIIDLQDNKFCGTASLYNVIGDEAEFGRYICVNPLQAIETELLILKYAFEEMNLRRVYCRTAEPNIKVWKQHLRYGFINVGEEVFTNAGKTLLLKVQEITNDIFFRTDYSFITKLVKKL